MSDSDADDEILVLGRQRIRELEQKFEKADKDANDTVKINQVLAIFKFDTVHHGSVLGSMSSSVDEDDFRRVGVVGMALTFFKKTHADVNHRLNWEEFQRGMKYLGFEPEIMKTVFDQTDTNNSGRIEQSELIVTMLRMLAKFEDFGYEESDEEEDNDAVEDDEEVVEEEEEEEEDEEEEEEDDDEVEELEEDGGNDADESESDEEVEEDVTPQTVKVTASPPVATVAPVAAVAPVAVVAPVTPVAPVVAVVPPASVAPVTTFLRKDTNNNKSIKKRLKVELTEDDFEGDEVKVEDARVDVDQDETTIVYLHMKVHRVDGAGATRAASVAIPVKLSGQLLAMEEEEDDEEDIETSYEIDSEFYSSVAGTETRKDLIISEPIRIEAAAVTSYVTLFLPVRVLKPRGGLEDTDVVLPLKFSTVDDVATN